MDIEKQKAIEMLEYIKNKNTLMGFSIAETETTPNYRGKLAITLLNLIEKQQSELEKQDNKIKELEGRCRNLDKEAQSYLEELMGDSTLKNRTIKQLNSELEKKDKEIDEMAEYIIELIKYNNPEEERDKKEIKEYFYKKVRNGK